MPNQRKKGKTKVGLWLTEQQRKRLDEMAEMKGLNISDMIKEAIRHYDQYSTHENEKKEKTE